MNRRHFTLFLGFYFYLLNVNAANDAQRVILLSSLIQIRALQAQLLLWWKGVLLNLLPQKQLSWPMLWLACKFDLDQSERKSSQVNTSARNPWPNGVASTPKFSTCVTVLATPFGQGFTLNFGSFIVRPDFGSVGPQKYLYRKFWKS